MATTDLFDKVRKAILRTVTGAYMTAQIAVAPVVASRPRVGRWGVYYNKTYANWMKAAEVTGDDLRRFDGPCAVIIEQIVEKPKTSKLDYPRGDIDNFAKGPLDVITKSEKLWADDVQIVSLTAFKRFANPGETPRSLIHIIPLEGSNEKA